MSEQLGQDGLLTGGLMKKFTDTQKKWALTATMIAALGCSVSFNSGTRSATLDLASESNTISDSVKVGNKVINVRLTSTADQRTVVEESPTTTAEGKATFECDDCRTYIVKQPLGDGEAMLKAVTKAIKLKYSNSVEDAVMDAMDVRKDEVAESRSRNDRPAPETEERRRGRLSEEEQLEILTDATKKCDTRRYDDDYDKSKCRATALVQALKVHKGKISQKISSQFYRDEISDGFANQIADFNTLNGDTKEYIDDSLQEIKTLMKQLPKDQLLLRYELAATSAKAFAQKYQQSQIDAMSNPFSAEGQRGILDTVFLQNQLYISNEGSLKSSGISLEDANKIFQYAYKVPVDAIMHQNQLNNQNLNGVNNNIGLNSRIPGVVPAPGYENQNLNSRSNINNLGRNNLPVQQGSLVLSDGTILPIAGAVIAPGEAQAVQSSNGPQAIVIIRQQGNSDGLTFGQPRSISDAARAEADRRNLLQGRSY